MNTEQHPLSGKKVKLNITLDASGGGVEDGYEYFIEDWWDHLTGGSWMDAEGNPAALKYAVRVGLGDLPIDNNVVYGKIGHYGHLIHVSELGELVE